MAKPPFIIAEIDVNRNDVFNAANADANFQNRSTTAALVRRPMRGFQIKDDTYGTLIVRSSSGEQATLANSSGAERDSLNFTSNFILQSVSEQRSEKFQASTTFGATYGFFFGETPRVMSFQAVLLNSADFQWEAEWWENYDKVIRGTKLTDSRSRVYLYYDEVVVEGYLLNAGTQKTSGTPFEVPLSFSMWVTNIEYLTPGGVGSVDFPVSDSQSASSDGIRVDYGIVESAGGQFVSTTAEVRRRNIEALKNKPHGFLAGLRNNLRSTTGYVDDQITAAKNFLFGRNLVIPEGFVVDDAQTGQALTGTVRLPAQFIPETAAPRSKFIDNTDEYLARYVQPPLPTPSDGVVDAQASLELQAQAGLQELGTPMEETGLAKSEAFRLLGRATFAVISVGVSVATAPASSRRDGVVIAAQEQARAEQLARIG